jgi:hypothetical protein
VVELDVVSFSVHVYVNSVVTSGPGLHIQSIDSDTVDDFPGRVTYVWPSSLNIPEVLASIMMPHRAFQVGEDLDLRWAACRLGFGNRSMIHETAGCNPIT